MKFSLRISHLLAIQAAIGLLVAVSLVGVSFWFVRNTDQTVDRVYAAKDVTADILPPPMYLIEMRLVLSQVLDGTMTPPQASDEIRRLAGEYEARVQYWTAHPPYGLEQQLLGPQHAAGQRFIEQARAFAALAASADAAALRSALAPVHSAYQAHRSGVDATVKAALAFTEASSTAAERNRQFVASTQLSLLALALGLLLLAGWWVRRRLAGPIRHAVQVAERIAGGDLSQPVPLHGSGETAELMRALQVMQESLTRMVVQVRLTTENIHTASDEIARGNHDLSQRTEQAASSLQQTAASMEQINSTVRSTADAARQANQMVLQAADVAARGGEVVGQAVNTMQTIHQSSQKIKDIIGVIDGIAFQTNILALNAAVEAARAGEQGRGFAVVAGEVRGLAQRSAGAAKEIKTLIGDSVGSVETGSERVSQAGQTMGAVVDSVRRVTDVITHISAAAGEQSEGINQVNQAVNHLDQMTQQNAALVEQSAAAAESLRQQAHQLADTVRRFQLSGLSSAA